MLLLNNIAYTFTASFGRTRTGKTVVVTVLDELGVSIGAGFTAAAVVELGGGVYGVEITFTSVLNGYIKFNNTTDSFVLFQPFSSVADDLPTVRKVLTNRWLITGNQLIEYDDDGTTPLNTYDLKKASVANDGTDPDERVPV